MKKSIESIIEGNKADRNEINNIRRNNRRKTRKLTFMWKLNNTI